MNTTFERYLPVLSSTTSLTPKDSALHIWSDGTLSCYYAPFDHINTGARVVLLGITPGLQQAQVALSTMQSALAEGLKPADALARAKVAASFSGPMRVNLVDLLDAVGVQRAIGIESCKQLFTSRADLVHFTSALRYPVFLGNENYSGSPAILGTPCLKSMVDRWLLEEAQSLPKAFWVPLGKEPTSVLRHFVEEGLLAESQVLDGLPHPSGANAERISYFLGKKKRSSLSAKTNPATLDAMRERLLHKIDTAMGMRPAPALAPTILPNVQVPEAAGPRDDATVAVVRSNSGQERYAKTFRLVSHHGETLFPVRVRNRATGRQAFNLAKRGAGTHTREHRIEVEDEAKAYEMVASGTYKIRATRGNGDAPSLLGLGDRVIKAVVRI